MAGEKNHNLKAIEEQYDTQSLQYMGDYIWPILRLKINEELRKKEGLKSRTFKLKGSMVSKLLLSFFYGIFNIFRLNSFSIWIFSSSDRRKKINSEYIDRVAGSFREQYANSLIIENPYPLGRHIKRKDMVKGYVMGQTILFAGAKLISFFLARPKISNESLLLKILHENDIQLNYRRILKDTSAQYRLMKIILRFTRPKAIFFVYAASSMGYIKAIKKKGIPTIELQHGVINKSHNAYNLYKDFGDQLFPDYLLTYGEKELEIFNERNYFIHPDHVFPIGYYFLEACMKAKSPALYEADLRSRFEKVIVFSLQDPFESYTFEFLLRTAVLNKDICYLLVPRNSGKPYREVAHVDNLIIERERNIYECLKIADFHATINSTCAIESLYFGVPNLLYDFKNWAWDYYGEILNDTGHTIFIKSPQQFIDALNHHKFYNKQEIVKVSEAFIKRDFKANLQRVLEEKIPTGNNE